MRHSIDPSLKAIEKEREMKVNLNKKKCLNVQEKEKKVLKVESEFDFIKYL